MTSARAARAFDHIDNMPGPLRQCVHEFGYEIVSEIMQSGVTHPNKIRAIVNTCWLGPRTNQNRAGIKGGSQTRVAQTLDALLIQSGATLSAATLGRFLLLNGLVVVPQHPNPQMVEASMEAIRTMGLLGKRDKHTIRLRAALDTGARQLWPDLFMPVVPTRGGRK